MEIIDIINKQDEVIGTIPHNRLYIEKPLHRIVHVLVFNSNGEVALQLRSQNKSYLPGYWTTSAGGHVQSGEDYKTAASRELFEEVGIKSEITDFKRDFYENHDGTDVKKYMASFKTIHDGPYNPNEYEVERLEFFTIEKVKEMIDSDEKLHPELSFIIEKYY